MKPKIKICCDDMRITVEGYPQHLKIMEGNVDNPILVRFSGHEISYCPYCGKGIEKCA